MCFAHAGINNFLPLWKDKKNGYKFDGRFNQGVVSINLPQIAIIADKNESEFWSLLDERLELCKEALMCRHYALLGTSSEISPIHWQYGAIARKKKDEKIDDLLYDGYSSISLGYIGIYEMTQIMKGVSHTEEEGKKFAIKVIKHLKSTIAKWQKETNLGFNLYGLQNKKVACKFAKIDKEKFGTIKNVTDKGYYTSSYLIFDKEKTNLVDKLKFEGEFMDLALDGTYSNISISNIKKENDLEDLIRFVYDNILYVYLND